MVKGLDLPFANAIALIPLKAHAWMEACEHVAKVYLEVGWANRPEAD